MRNRAARVAAILGVTILVLPLAIYLLMVLGSYRAVKYYYG